MKIYIGSDHNGYNLKQELMAYLGKHDYDVEDAGDKTLNPEDDFPQFAAAVANRIIGSTDTDPRGILICGSGQGMAMAANRFTSIRAALVWNATEAKAARREDDANVLVLPAHILEADTANEIVEAWLNTEFDRAPRRIRRLKQIDEL
jgi:ribose 5-phosphate isomerase B